MLIFDDNSDFSNPITTIPLTHTDAALACNNYSFVDTTASYVNWELITTNSSFHRANGAAEMTFHGPNTPAAPVPAPASLRLGPAFAASASRIRRLRRRSLRLTAVNTAIS